MTALTFNPKNITKRLISELPERAQDIIIKRFGLDSDEIMTLEAIGNIYDITRERVRQIENHSLNKLAESDVLREHNDSLTELRELVHELGIVVPEAELLGHVSSKRDVQNHVYLLLRLGEPFEYEKEDRHFTHRWYVDKAVHEAVKEALHAIHDKLGPEDLVSEKEILDWFRSHVNDSVAPDRHLSDDEVIKRWLRLSRVVDRNPLGEWGLADSPNVRVKGVRDYAYLVIRQHGSPMHFTEVTKRIEELFGKDAHVATTHNELIKDNRFVLVGRGLYALTDWGYMQGVVKDVIAQILKQEGPMTRDEIVERVLKERYVKPNTVVVNLQDANLFEKTDEGQYVVRG